MYASIEFAKWLVVPASIVIAQFVLHANGAFESMDGVWGFVAASLIVLLVWRHRLGRLVSKFPETEARPVNVAASDRRFAFLSLSTPFLGLIAVQLAILSLFLSDLVWEISWVQRYSGTLWAIFGITAVGFWQIGMGINLLIVSHSSRWNQILSEHNRSSGH